MIISKSLRSIKKRANELINALMKIYVSLLPSRVFVCSNRYLVNLYKNENSPLMVANLRIGLRLPPLPQESTRRILNFPASIEKTKRMRNPYPKHLRNLINMFFNVCGSYLFLVVRVSRLFGCYSILKLL